MSAVHAADLQGMTVPQPARSDAVYVDALRITTRPALVAAYGRAALAVLVGAALVLSVWKGLPLTASVIATGGLLGCVLRRPPRR